MLMRATGIGPAGSLLGAGVIKERERLLVTDFAGPLADSTLGGVVAEAVRADLGESPTVAIVEPARVQEVLTRMQVPGSRRLDLALARDVAARDGIRVIVDGDVAAVGQTYVVSARLLSTDSGTVLTAAHETAVDSKDLIPAIDRLAKRLRAKLGESFRTVHATPPLEDVTTASLPALRSYTEGTRAAEVDGNFDAAITDLQRAVTLDTGFAMAYRKLAAVLSRTGYVSRQVTAIEKAYAHRDRLTSVERNNTIGSYYYWGPTFDPHRSRDAFEAAVAEQPHDLIAVDNAADLEEYLRDFASAETNRKRELVEDSSDYLSYVSLARNQFYHGDSAAARSTIAELARRIPDNTTVGLNLMLNAAALGKYDSATVALDAARRAHPTDPFVEAYAGRYAIVLAQLRGRLRAADRAARERAAVGQRRGIPAVVLEADLSAPWRQIWFLDRPQYGAALLDSVLRRDPLADLDPLDRPYGAIAALYAAAGRPDRGRAILATYDSVLAGRSPRFTEEARHTALGEIALAEHRYADAVAEFRRADLGACVPCALPRVGRAYDLGGNADSAIAVYERYIRAPALERVITDGDYLAGVHKRLGELYAARGDTANATAHYTRFIELWKDADPELQPAVTEVKRRLQALAARN